MYGWEFLTPEIMKEMYYIDLERRADVQPAWAAYNSEPAVPTEDKLISRFEPRRFPLRECRPVTRRRSLSDVWKLIEETDGWDDL